MKFPMLQHDDLVLARSFLAPLFPRMALSTPSFSGMALPLRPVR